MRRFILAAPLLLLLSTSGCSMPRGMNDECNWPAERGGVRAPTDKHLIADVRVAEELALRYADARYDSKPAHGRLQTACEAKLFATIAESHGITLAALADARRQLGRQRWETAVHVPLIAFYFAVAILAARWIRRRFPRDEKTAAVVATLFVSLLIGVVFVAAGHLWAGVVEMIRVGNTHMSYRAARLGWREHGGGAFAAAVLSFWCVVLFAYRDHVPRTVD